MLRKTNPSKKASTAEGKKKKKASPKKKVLIPKVPDQQLSNYKCAYSLFQQYYTALTLEDEEYKDTPSVTTEEDPPESQDGLIDITSPTPAILGL